MAKITIYKNSVIATILSFLGTAFALCGVVLLFAGGMIIGIIMILMGVAMMLWAASISEKKAFHTWLKAAKEKADIDGMIRASASGAVKVYNLNPGKNMLRYVCKLNPEAGALIKQNLAEKKSSKDQNS